MATKLCLFVLLFVIPYAFGIKNTVTIVEDTTNNTLQAIQQRIQQSGAISESSLGDSNVWKWLLEALLIGDEVYTEMQLHHIGFHFSDNEGNLELYINGTTDIWNMTNVEVEFVLYIASELELALQFAYTESQIPEQLWANNNGAWFSGLTLVGTSTASFSTSTFTDNMGNSFQEGLTMVAHLQTNEKLPIQDSLFVLIHGPNDQNRIPIVGDLVANFPLSIGQDLTHWTLTVDGTIYFSSPNVETNDVVIDFQMMSNLESQITLTCDITITDLGLKGTEPVTFHIMSEVSTSSGFTFNGNLVGTWQNPFDITWMSFNSLSVNFQFNPLAAPTIANLQFAGGMNLDWTGLAKPITVNFAGDLSNNVQQIMIVAQVPVIDIAQIFNHTLNGKQPLMIDQLTVDGLVNFALSTYDGEYQEGFTINGNVDLSQTGSIANAVRAVNAEPESWTYQFQLYVPCFSENPQDIDFYLTETGPIFLSKSLTMMGYHIEFDMTPEAKVALSSTVNWNNTATNTITFIVSADIEGNDQQTELDFSGQMEGVWVHPFGLKWLTLANVLISLDLDNGIPQSFSFQGTANITFGNSADAGITIILQGPDFVEFSFTLDLLVNNMQQFLDSVTNPSRVPAVTSEISLICSLTVSSFAHDGYVAGITLNGNAMVAENGAIADAILTFNPSNPLYFTVSIVLPIFSSTPWDVSFSFTEQGTYVISKSVTVNEFAVAFAIGDDPSASVSADSIVKISKNPVPFHIVFSAAIGGSAVLELSGTVQGAWQPFSMDWITATNTSAVLSFADRSVAALGFSGACNITYFGNTQFYFALETAADFYDSYIEITALSIANLGDFIQAITHKTPPPFIADLVTLSNDFAFILSTYDTGSIHEGLTLYDKVTITGPLVNKLAVFNDNNQVASSTYGLGLTVPVFPGQDDVSIYLTTPIWTIKDNLVLHNVTIEIDSTPPTFSISGGALVTFKQNPQLLFVVDGSLSADGAVTLGGGMVGTWDNMFGIKGVDISNVELQVGFNPAMCGVDLCLSSLGLGYNLTIGSKIVAFYGLVNIPDLLDIFLEGEIMGNGGMALTIRDIATEWNLLVGNSLGIPINVNNIPANWGFMDTDFYIAPEAGTFNNMQYQQGFWIDSGIIMFGMEVLVNIKVTTDDFEFNVQINKDTFEQLLQNEINVMNQISSNSPDVNIVSVSNVTLNALSFWNVGHQQNPIFILDYTFIGSPNVAKISIPLVGLYDSFGDFFNNYLKGLFQ